MDTKIAKSLHNVDFVYRVAVQMSKHPYITHDSNFSLDSISKQAFALIARVTKRNPRGALFVDTLRQFARGSLEVETTIQYLYEVLKEMPNELWDITLFIPHEFRVEWYILLLRTIPTKLLIEIAKKSIDSSGKDWFTYPLSSLEYTYE